MTKLYVSEYLGLATAAQSDSVDVVAAPSIADQVVDYTAGVATSAAFNALTSFIEVCADSACSIALGTAPTATTANFRIPANQLKRIRVPTGGAFKISAITNP